MATNYRAKGDIFQYTCGASEEVSSGDVLFVNGVPGVALVDIGNNETGSVQMTGVFEVHKHSDSTNGAEFKTGAPVFWDAVEEEAVVTAGQPLLGFAYADADKGDDTVEVILAGDPKDAPVPVEAGEALNKNQLVYPSGFDADKGVIKVKKADADGANPKKVAWYVLPADISSGDLGVARRSHLATGVDTSAVTSVGDPVYLSTTAGGWTKDAPTDGGAGVQQVGVVTKKDASGEILFLVGDSKAVTVNTTE